MYNYVHCGSCAPAATASHALATLSAADWIPGRPRSCRVLLGRGTPRLRGL